MSLCGEHARCREPEVDASAIRPGGEAFSTLADGEIDKEVARVARQSGLGRRRIDRRAFELQCVAGEFSSPLDETIVEFYCKLVDGTIAEQCPDGEEIVASMKRAVLTAPGVAEWFEMFFCPTPLQHERQTQYDSYFSELTAQPVATYGEIQGASLWSYMASKAAAAKHAV